MRTLAALALLLLLLAPTSMAAVSAQARVRVPADGGHDFGADFTVAPDGALARALSDSFLTPRNGGGGTYVLVQDPTWRIARTTPTVCSGGDLDNLLSSQAAPSFFGHGRFYEYDPCDGGGIDLSEFDGTLQSVPQALSALQRGVIHRASVPGLTALDDIERDAGLERSRYAISGLAGDGWFAVHWETEPLAGDGIHQWLGIHFGDNPLPSHIEHLGPGNTSLWLRQAVDQDLWVQFGDRSLRFTMDVEAHTVTTTTEAPPGGVGRHGTIARLDQGRVEVLRRNATSWFLDMTLTPPEGRNYRAAAADGDLVVAGMRALTRAQECNDAPVCLNTPTLVDQPGVVEVHQRLPNGTWRLHEEIAGNGRNGRFQDFARAVGIDGWDVLIGVPADGHGAIHVRTVNRWPVPAFTWTPETPLSLDPVVFRDLSTDFEGERITASWDFDGDGAVDAHGRVATHAFQRSGPREVTLFVEDPQEGRGILTQTVHVRNRAPLADFDVQPRPLWRTAALAFDDLSHDLDGDIVSWAWDFGDGRSSTASHPIVTYTARGLYDVSLTVTDNLGATDTRTRTIEILNHPPIVRIQAPLAPWSLDPFTAHATVLDPDGQIVARGWEDGLGNLASALVPAQLPGPHRITHWATDNDGDTTRVHQMVEVRNRVPTADFIMSPGPLATGRDVAFSDRSGDRDGTIQQWTWHFGDGNRSAEPSPRHAYAAKGTYTVNLTVQDDFGAWSPVVNQTIVVANDPPVALFEWSADADVWARDLSRDPDGVVTTREWFLDGQPLGQGDRIVVPSAEGSRLLVLRITDDQGTVSLAQAWIGPVADPAPKTSTPVEPEPTPAPEPDPAAQESSQPAAEAPRPQPDADETPSSDGASPFWIVAAVLGAAALVGVIVRATRPGRQA